jgi:predicted nucleic acid-binding protein
MKRIYLDSNVLIAHFSLSKSEEGKTKVVEEALKAIAQLQDVQLCTSMWALAETINILVSRHGMERGHAAEIESQFVNQKRLGSLKLCFVDVSPKKDYDFMEFFYDVRQGVLHFHSGVGDIIHSVIMKNNGIEAILTFDEKDDFKQIPGLTAIHPKDVKI